MKVFRLYPIGEYEDAGPINSDDFDQLEALDGTPKAADWSPIAFEILTEDGDSGAPLSRADVPWLGSFTLILRDKAIDTAGPIVAPFGELLPVECETAKLVMFNATEVLDALDEDASEIERFRSSGRIMSIENHVFRADAIPERAVFKIPQSRKGQVFYTEAVVNDLKALGLTGIDFTTVWDSGSS